MTHIWEYDNFEHRSEVRKALGASPEWNAEYVSELVTMLRDQENSVVFPPSWFPYRERPPAPLGSTRAPESEESIGGSKGETAVTASAAEPVRWQCQICTSVNEAQWTVCARCNNPRHPDSSDPTKSLVVWQLDEELMTTNYVYEYWCYKMLPGGPNTWGSPFQKAIEGIREHFELHSIWYTDIGDVDKIHVFWRHPSQDARHSRRQDMRNDPLVVSRNLKVAPHILNLHTKILIPTPWSPLQ